MEGRKRGARTLGGGDGEEGGTAPAVERRGGEGERDGPGGGGDRGGRDGLHGRREGERSEVGGSRREIFFCPSSAGEFHFVFEGAGED